jgi:hypothetical protein
MKKSVLLSVLAICGLSMIQPVSAQASRPGIIAEVVTAGGLFPMPPQGVRIYADGSVLAYRKSQSSVVAQLTPALVKTIVNSIAELTNQELVDQHPDQPGCLDAPTTTYFVQNQNGQVKVGQIMECKDFLHPDYRASSISKFLEGFNELSRAR